MIKLTKKIIFKNGTKVEGDKTGAVLTDLSKTFDWTDHSFLLAKLNSYEFEKQSIDFI